tara:strand:- start:605 stop:1204 length:600 start_codon:yes stop_codon:yes gene_type:complete
MTDRIQEALDRATSLGYKTFDHHFGKGSLSQLEGVHPDIVDLAKLTIRLCQYDGTVISGGGLRTEEQAQENAENGTGIVDSLHRKQSDGYGHAVDVIPYVNGKATWEMKYCEEMAKAAKLAAALLSVPIRQGCDWNMNGTFGESGEYDWCHHELPKEKYQQQAKEELARSQAELLGDETIPSTGTACPHCGKLVTLGKA